MNKLGDSEPSISKLPATDLVAWVCKQTYCKQLCNETETEAHIPGMPQSKMPANTKKKDG